MASCFDTFLADLDEFRETHNISCNYIETRKYGLRIGTNVLPNFKKYLDDENKFDTETKNNFKSMFQVGQDCVGLRIIGLGLGEYANSVLLYSISENKVQSQTDSFDWSYSKKLFDSKKIKDPVTGAMLFWFLQIKPTSLHISYNKDCTNDSMGEENCGTFSMHNTKEEPNKYHMSGDIDYITSQLNMIQVIDSNVALAHKALDGYNKLAKMLSAPPTNGKGAAKSSSGKGGKSSSAPAIKIPPLPPYDKMQYKIEYIKYGAPLQMIWRWDMPKESEV